MIDSPLCFHLFKISGWYFIYSYLNKCVVITEDDLKLLTSTKFGLWLIIVQSAIIPDRLISMLLQYLDLLTYKNVIKKIINNK